MNVRNDEKYTKYRCERKNNGSEYDRSLLINNERINGEVGGYTKYRILSIYTYYFSSNTWRFWIFISRSVFPSFRPI